MIPGSTRNVPWEQFFLRLIYVIFYSIQIVFVGLLYSGWSAITLTRLWKR
jgi:hypothetical protein